MFSQSGSDYGKHFILSADELRPKKANKKKKLHYSFTLCKDGLTA